MAERVGERLAERLSERAGVIASAPHVFALFRRS